MAAVDQTHDPKLRSFVASANGHPDFPIQNLPLGVFTPPDEAGPRIGVAIGDAILDLVAAHATGPFSGEASRAVSASLDSLNAVFALGAGARRALRGQLSAMLAEGSVSAGRLDKHLHRASQCTMHLPARIGDYTDFYAGVHHATNVGRLMRPDNPLMPNYKYVPIGYHGRASSVRPSGQAVRRPSGQRKRPDEQEPSFGPCRNLDFELELGVWIGSGSELGRPIPIGAAADHIAGYCLLNDWSARDIQGWEYQPLGPFLAKSFATTISPWVVTPEALAPFRIALPPRRKGDPPPLAYLHDGVDQREGGLDIELQATLHTAAMRAKSLAPHRLTLSNTRYLYWTPAQLVAHHASNGCNLQPGDLFGSGTISSPDAGGEASLLEATHGGRRPIALEGGEQRRFLEEGDEITLSAHARRDGVVTIGFGECRGVIA